MQMRLARLRGVILKVLVQILMLLALSIVPTGRSLPMRSLQICLSGICGTHGTRGNQLLQVL
jgi:hypothetical protein